MSVTLTVENDLTEQAKQIGNHKTETAAVREALAEYIQHRKQMDILFLFHRHNRFSNQLTFQKENE